MLQDVNDYAFFLKENKTRGPLSKLEPLKNFAFEPMVHSLHSTHKKARSTHSNMFCIPHHNSRVPAIGPDRPCCS
jgi:hypothetical protein